MSLECRDLALSDCEVKFAGNDSGVFEGYASVFGGVDSYGDTIVRGAYAETLKQENRKAPILMLFGHNPGRVIGKWTDVAEDSKGLHVRGEFTPGHTDAQNVRASMKHGAISGLSIGFYARKAEETETGRILKGIDLVEVSVVSMPADTDARVDLASVKAYQDDIKSIRDAERFLRDAGMSKAAAAAFLSQVKSMEQGDPDEVANLKAEHKALQEKYVKAKTALYRAGIFI